MNYDQPSGIEPRGHVFLGGGSGNTTSTVSFNPVVDSTDHFTHTHPTDPSNEFVENPLERDFPTTSTPETVRHSRPRHPSVVEQQIAARAIAGLEMVVSSSDLRVDGDENENGSGRDSDHVDRRRRHSLRNSSHQEGAGGSPRAPVPVANNDGGDGETIHDEDAEISRFESADERNGDRVSTDAGRASTDASVSDAQFLNHRGKKEFDTKWASTKYHLIRFLKDWKGSIIYFLIFAAILPVLGVLVWKEFAYNEWIVMVVLVIMIWALFVDFPTDFVMLGVVTAFMIFKILPAKTALTGFADPNMLSIGFLVICAAGVEATGVMDSFARYLYQFPRNLWQTQLIILIPVAFMSVFVNNTPLVAIYIPIIERNACRIPGVHLSKMMMPLSFAALFGGVCSTIGTSTNLFTKALIDKDPTLKVSLGFFDVGKVGGPLTVVFFIYLVFLSPYWLPIRKTPSESIRESAREFVACVLVKDKSPLIGKTIERATFRYLPSVKVFRIERRDGSICQPVNVLDRIQAYDKMFLTGAAMHIRDMYGVPGIVPSYGLKYKWYAGEHNSGPGDQSLSASGGAESDCGSVSNRSSIDQGEVNGEHVVVSVGDGGADVQSTVDGVVKKLELTEDNSRDRTSTSGPSSTGNESSNNLHALTSTSSSASGSRFKLPFQNLKRPKTHAAYTVVLVEAVVSRNAGIIGRTIRELDFPSQYDAAVVAVHRYETKITNRISDVTIEPGDVLLLETYPKRVDLFRKSKDFYLTSVITDGVVADHSVWKRIISIGVFATIVITNAVDILELACISLFGVFVLIFTKCMTIEKCRRAVNVPLLVTISGSFALSAAMSGTKVGQELGDNMFAVFKPIGAIGILFGVYIACCVLTAVLSNSAAVAVMFPITINALKKENTSLIKGGIICIMVAASCNFSTPIGYQTHLMVAGPGGYKFVDFVKFGLPLDIISAIVTSLLSFYLY